MTVKSEITEIPANELTVDIHVQRQLDAARVAKIAAKWDDMMVGVLTVSCRQDASGKPCRYVVLDGQTRLAALRSVCGIETNLPVNCQVYTGLTLQEEAAIFLDHNDRKAVRPQDRFRIALVAREQWATDILNIAEEYDYAPRGIESAAKGRFNAITTVEKLYRTDGGISLKKAFGTITKAWGHVPDAVGVETLNGLGLLYTRHPEINAGEFAAKLSKLGHGQFVSDVQMERRRSRSSVSQAAYVTTVLFYNRRRSSGRIEI
jgi:hypothetical protein